MRRVFTPLIALALLVGIGAPATAGGGGFDEFGYNNVARNFVGTCASWATAKGISVDYCGYYAADKLVMKWNSEWDRGNDEAWANPPYNAWTDNEWNGAFPGGSGSIWHYKIVWIGGDCGSDYTALPNGGYCIWGQFETIMDQGVDPNIAPGHMFFGLAGPAGYGAYYSH